MQLPYNEDYLAPLLAHYEKRRPEICMEHALSHFADTSIHDVFEVFTAIIAPLGDALLEKVSVAMEQLKVKEFYQAAPLLSKLTSISETVGLHLDDMESTLEGLKIHLAHNAYTHLLTKGDVSTRSYAQMVMRQGALAEELLVIWGEVEKRWGKTL